MRPLRVLQISHDYQGPFVRVCNQYVAPFTDHHITTVFVCGEPDSEVAEGVGGDEVVFLNQPAGALRGIKLGTLFKLSRLFRANHYDIVIAHRYKSIYFAGVMGYFFPIGLLLGVVHEHHVFRRITRSLFVTFWCRKLVLLGVSDSVGRSIEQYCGPLRPQGRLHTMYHAVDPDQAGQILDRGQARQELQIDEDAFVFGSVGRLIEKKQHDLLLRAMAAENDQMRDDIVLRDRVQLVIIGDGPLRQRLQTLARELGIADRVVFKGHVGDAFRLMRAFDCFVFPSGEDEAFGIVLLEAMQAGVPVITSDSAGPLEVVGENGLRFEANQPVALAHVLSTALRSLAETPENAGQGEATREMMASEGIRRIQAGFTRDIFKSRMWQLISANLRDREMSS
jgi:glycosyltransferase involved in cell wall biosynthesis